MLSSLVIAKGWIRSCLTKSPSQYVVIFACAGLVIFPSVLPAEQQLRLLKSALCEAPEPPSRTNHTLGLGDLPGLWQAAHRALRLKFTKASARGRPLAGDAVASVSTSAPRDSECGGVNPAAAASGMQKAAIGGVSAVGSADAPTATDSLACSSETVGAANACQAPCKQLNGSHAYANGSAVHHAAAPPPQNDLSKASQPAGRNSGNKEHQEYRFDEIEVGESRDNHIDCSSCGSGNAQGAGACADSLASTDSNSQNRTFESCWSAEGPGPAASALLDKLRWATLGPQYNWTARQYEFDVPHRPLPEELRHLAVRIAAVAESVLQRCCRKANHGNVGDGTLTAAAAADGCPARHEKESCIVDDSFPGAADGCSIRNEAESQHQSPPVATGTAPLASPAAPYKPDAALVNYYREGMMSGLTPRRMHLDASDVFKIHTQGRHSCLPRGSGARVVLAACLLLFTFKLTHIL